MRKQIIDKKFDEERALYHLQDADIINCTFAGTQDGESVLKEASDITLTKCDFSLRYPLWHVTDFKLSECTMDELTRAAIWYAENGTITKSNLNGIKAVRECSDIKLTHCKVVSPEFGWKSDHITLSDTTITSEYLFFDSSDITLDHVKMHGKYSFQYVKNLHIKDSQFDTKDAFWHAKNVTVRNSVIKGEYLGWFSDRLTLIDCKIIGTQPLCYCTNLRLINCTMEDTDLSFEYSDVQADIKGNIISIKNPRSGLIEIDSVGNIIREDPVMDCDCEVIVRDQPQE